MNRLRKRDNEQGTASEVNEERLAQVEKRLKALEEAVQILEVELGSYKVASK